MIGSARRHVFIAGLHRSGTSILHRCLCDHPEISGFENTGVPEDEGQHLQSIYPTARACGGPGRFGFNPESFMDETSPLVSPENRSQLEREWDLYWNLERRILVEKSPPNLVRARFLQALFPEACFVVMVRHPLAVSYATQKWSKTPLNSLLAHWLVCHRRFRRDRRYLKRLLVVRYEDFVAAPQETLSSVHRFLGVSHHILRRRIRGDVNTEYFDRWRNVLATGNIREKIMHYALILKYEAQIRRFDYSLRLKDAPVRWFAGEARNQK